MSVLSLMFIWVTLHCAISIVLVNSAEVDEVPRDGVVNRVFEPIYELQLTAWPAGMQPDELSASMFEDQVFVAKDETAGVPLYEDQIVVFPADIDSPATGEDEKITDLLYSVQDTHSHTDSPIVAIHNSHTFHTDGTSEYKLILSNGLVDYKRIYKKVVDGKVVQAQSGFYSVPVDDDQTMVGIVHYFSDEKGHRVYKEKIHRNNLANMEFVKSNW